jgi:hypothetical protein
MENNELVVKEATLKKGIKNRRIIVSLKSFQKVIHASLSNKREAKISDFNF